MTIGEIFKKLRTDKKLKQGELAKLFFVSQATISQIENNATTPTTELLEKASTFFNVSVDYLLGKSDNPNLSNSDNSMVTQVMFRMDTDGLSSKEIEELKKELENFAKFRRNQIESERKNEE